MSVRRWIGIAGVVVAVAGGTAATVREGGEAEFEAEVALRLAPSGVVMPSFERPERLLDQSEVRELVRRRLGEAPPVQVKPASRDTVLVRSRGATASDAAEATTTYAASYIDVQRRRAHAGLEAASVPLQHKIGQLESQVDSAAGPQRATIAAQIGYFVQRLEELRAQYESPNQGAEIVGLSPAVPVDDGAGRAWTVAALGGAVALGAGASARRSRPSPPAGDGACGQGR